MSHSPPFAEGHPELALPARSVHCKNHNIARAAQHDGTTDWFHRMQQVLDMERNGNPPVDSRKACVIFLFSIHCTGHWLMPTGHPYVQRDPESVLFGTCHGKFVYLQRIHVVNKLDHNLRRNVIVD
jgi:hypothetical protein